MTSPKAQPQSQLAAETNYYHYAGNWSLRAAARHSSAHREGAQHPVPGQTPGNMKPVVDVGVEALHGPHRVLLQLAVQRALLLHVLRLSDSRGRHMRGGARVNGWPL